jgi:hypothetical protein
VIDSVVGLVVTDAIKDTVPGEQFADGRLEPGEAQGHAGLLCEIEDLAHLGRALGVDEVDPLAIEHDPGDLGCGQRNLPATTTALAATAASPELGPVEICRLVPKTA